MNTFQNKCKISVSAADGPEKTGRKLGRRVGLAFGVLAALNLAVQLLASAVLARLVPGGSYPLWLTWLLSFVPLYGVAFPVFYTLLQRLPRVPLVRRRVGVGQFAMYGCMSLCLMYAGSLVGNLLNWLIGLAKGNPVDNSIQLLAQQAPIWQMLLFVCLLAPIGEELIFCTLLRSALPFGEKQAILFTALAFGLFHGNLYQFFYAFLVRLLLAQLYLRCGRLGPCMLLHGVINLLGSVVGQLAIAAGEKATVGYGLCLLLTAVYGGVLLRGRWKCHRRAAPRDGCTAARLFCSPGALLAYLVCLVMILLSLL